MPKKGDVRADGKVFVHNNATWGEYWTTREKFLETHGDDWFERRDQRKANVATRAIAKGESKARRLAREAEIASRPVKVKRAWRKFLTEEERIQGRKEWEKARYLDPAKREKRRLWMEAHEAKRNPHKLLHWGMRILVSIQRERSNLVSVALREMGRHEARMKREALARHRRPRIVLTPGQRLDAKRLWKRNCKHLRRARLRGQDGGATASEVRQLKKSAKGRCFYCRAKVKMLTLDHIVPIAKGGGHTLDNIVFACHLCNSKKRDLDPGEYAKKHGLLLV